MDVFAVAAGFELSEQQREVVTRLLTAGNGIDAVIGVAGAGKSTLMDACRIAWDATGTTYAGACLSAVGAQGLQDASAIPARTVASWLQRIESGEGLSGIDVLVVDEAAMTDDRSAAKLLTEAAFAYGTVTNLYGWVTVGGMAQAISFAPGAPVGDNLVRFTAYVLATSLGWDLGRAALTVVLTLTVGGPLLRALRRATRRANFEAQV
ncbi:AAA family ATPase, partial [Streptomyces sp. NPDC127123]|uniref:AAA family ATPase n=1 Tax=Streptomyces sp. NPDC127123 TaxID=3345372 RepID=UPI0036294028